MTKLHLVTIVHKDGTATQHINIETGQLDRVMAETDWSTVTDVRIKETGERP